MELKNKALKQILIGLFCIGLYSTTFAINQGVRFNNLSIQDGLSHNHITSIFQDSRGFMWFGTRDGLNRFDGNNVKIINFSHKDTFSTKPDVINSIAEHKSGNGLWIGTNKGLYFYDFFKEELYQHLRGKNNQEIFVSNIIPSKDGGFWVSSKKGLAKLRADDVAHPQFKGIRFRRSETGLIGKRITYIFEDKENTLWISFSSGELCTFSKEGKTKGLSVCKNYNWGTVSGISETAEGTLLLFSKKGEIIEYNRTEQSFLLISSKIFSEGTVVNSIYKDDSNKLWIATDKGIWELSDRLEQTKDNADNRFDFQKYQHDPGDFNSLVENQVRCLYKDKSGILWAGTRGNGISKITIDRKYFKYHHNYPKDKTHYFSQINALFEDSEGLLWFCTNNGLCNYNRKANKYTFFNNKQIGIADNKKIAFLTLCEDQNGNIWIGTYGTETGLIRYSKPDNQFRIFNSKNSPLSSNSVTSIVCLKNGDLMLGTYKGQVHIIKQADQNRSNPNIQKFEAIPTHQSPQYIFSRKLIYEDLAGNIWITTTLNGEFCYTPANKSIKHYTHANTPSKSISTSHVTSVFQEKKQELWFGTANGLVRQNTETGKQKRYTMENGLPAKSIVSVKNDDHGNLWLLMPNWISRFNPATEEVWNIQFHHKTFYELYIHEPFLKTRDGSIYAGTQANGYFSFTPDSIKPLKFVPPVVITDLKISGKSEKIAANKQESTLTKSISHTEKIRVKHNQNNLTFEFASLSYFLSEQNRYATMLDGAQKEWQLLDSEQTSINYFNLQPGDYIFRIKAANYDGVWNSKETTLKIEVLPPWWKTQWAYAMYIFICLTLLYAIYRYTYRLIELRNRLSFEQLEKQKIHELNQDKLRFFTNISHEIRTPLTLILGPLEKLIKDSNPESNAFQSYQLMHNNTNRLLRLINQLLDFRKIEGKHMKLHTERQDLISFVKRITLLFAEQAKEQSIELEFESTHKNLPVWFDPEKLEKIVFNLLSNALKYTPKEGHIHISVQTPNDSIVEIVVTDTGKGIQNTDLDNIFNRFYQANNAQTGTGIGLSLVKSFTELHNGSVEAKSEVGKGSCFTVKLPLTNENSNEETLASAHKSIIKTDDKPIAQKLAPLENDKKYNDAKKQTLMLVEDNKDIRDFINDILSAKYNLLMAENGKEALILMKEQIPDLIISDVMMPEMDGFQLLKEIRKDFQLSHIPVILLTSLNTAKDQIHGYKTGADEYIPKPFNPDFLEVRIQNLITLRNKLKERYKREIKIGAKEITVASADEKLLERATRFIEENISNPNLTVEQLGHKIGISRVHFYRKIKLLTDLTATEFIRTIRLKYAARILIQKKLNISEVAYESGFTNPVSFTRAFKKQFGVTPTQYVVNNSNTDK